MGKRTPPPAARLLLPPPLPARLLLRTQFVPRAADAEEKHPELHKQLNNHHEQLETATEGAASRLRVCVQAGRNLGTGGGPVPVPAGTPMSWHYAGQHHQPMWWL